MEFEQKITIIRKFLKSHHLEALLLSRVSSFAWATCGAASYVNTASTGGIAALLITPNVLYLVTNNIEAPRLEQEEKLKEQGWEFHIARWDQSQDTLTRLTTGLRLGADDPYPNAVDLSSEIARLRARLTPQEGERFRQLGQLCAAAMNAAIHGIRPGQSEYEIAALLSSETEQRGVQVIVNLIATDERIFAFRHPLPTSKKLDRYAMLVLCGRRSGLVCSLTRLVYFGQLPGDLRHKVEAVAQVDAALIAATRPGHTLGDILREGFATYTQVGFPDEWQLHHQGGPAGYEPREYFATPVASESVSIGQVFAWNPSISGTKSEDTILVGPNSNEVLTFIPGWPMLPVVANGQEIPRPAILEIL